MDFTPGLTIDFKSVITLISTIDFVMNVITGASTGVNKIIFYYLAVSPQDTLFSTSYQTFFFLNNG